MMDRVNAIQMRLAAVRERIARAEARFNRIPGSVQLVLASKAMPAEFIEAAVTAGQTHFGENYLQEALTKINDSRLKGCGITWHFIGPLQTNKTKKIAAYLDWVHSIDTVQLASRLNEQRLAHLPPLNVCLQVNISAEPSKAGVDLEHLPTLASEVAQLPRMHLRGLMAIPAPAIKFEQQRLPYRNLHAALKGLRDRGFTLDTLSMGMSEDLDAAIAEGATLVRVGTAIFGPR